MKFSELYRVKIPKKGVDWFDPILSLDTGLFIDPFLLYEDKDGPLAGSHDDVIAFFNSAFSLVAKSKGNKTSLEWWQASRLLVFPEPAELCLGYTSKGTGGSGSGAGLGTTMVSAIWEAIQAGLTQIKHFEEVSIIREGIGADRISDMTANLIRPRLAAYTEEICNRFKVPTHPLRFPEGTFDPALGRWVSAQFRLPRNPYNRKGVLLVPSRYLRDLPTVNANEFWDYCLDNENETLRREYGDDITRHVSKETIVEFARNHPDLRADYLRDREKKGSRPYNLLLDRKNVRDWYDASAAYCVDHPQTLVAATEAEFKAVIEAFCHEYQHFVEQNKGWQQLWNDNNTQRGEQIAQNLFLGIVKHYCQANNIDISREPNIGRGPVDFKFSQGFEKRAVLEVKKANNTRFWNGLKEQLPTYMLAEKVRIGIFLVVVYSKTDEKRVKDIDEQVKAIRTKTGKQFRTLVVDARKPLSASKL
jgi:hypothetical protein